MMSALSTRTMVALAWVMLALALSFAPAFAQPAHAWWLVYRGGW